MDNLSYTTNQDIIALLCQRLKEYRLAARISQTFRFCGCWAWNNVCPTCCPNCPYPRWR